MTADQLALRAFQVLITAQPPPDAALKPKDEPAHPHLRAVCLPIDLRAA
jgi:hypothetical protein